MRLRYAQPTEVEMNQRRWFGGLVNQINAGESDVSRRSTLAKSARRIWINSASDSIVIARRQRRGADRRRADCGGTCAHTYAHIDIPARVAAAIDAIGMSAPMELCATESGAMAARVKSAEMIAMKSAAAAASHSIGRNTRDAEHGSRGN
jgi:hypothetical protein